MDNQLFAFSLTVFTGLIAMLNPLTSIPAFTGVLSGYTAEQKRYIIKKACIVALVIIIAFVLLGKFIFSIFGITIPAFKITGGILIFKIGFDMLQSRTAGTKKMPADIELDDSIAISPLAIPLLSGPGTIVTTMDFISNTGYIHLFIVTVIVTFVLYINYLALKYGDFILSKLGRNVISVLDKLMGLILAIMGTGMVIAGIKLLF
ncbi:MarC family protein [Riemerella columbipharyngis]|nr:MarC family protein [Riemerella columbipharyngis]